MPVSAQKCLAVLCLLLPLVFSSCSQNRSSAEKNAMLLQGQGRGVVLLDARLEPRRRNLIQRLFQKQAPASGWWERHAEIVVDQPIPADASSHVEGLMLARARGRDQAVEGFLEVLAALPDLRGYATVADALREEPALRESVSKAVADFTTIVRASTLEEREQYRVVAQLPLWRISRLLYAMPNPEDWGEGKREAESAVEDQALRLALMQAERDVRVKIENTTVGQRTIGQILENNRPLWAILREVLTHPEIIHQAFPEPGACELTIQVDMTPLYQAILSQAEGAR